MTVSGIYEIRNVINGNVYVGSSVDVGRRLKEHFSKLRLGSHYNSHLQRAYNKYGHDSFSWSIIELVPDASRLIATEQIHIDNRNPAYNICRVAGHPGGLRHSEATRAKISAARLGAGNGMYGRTHTSEAIARIAAASASRKDDPETLLALAKGRGWNKGIPFSVESRAKMSAAKSKNAVERIDPISGEVTHYPSQAAVRSDGFHPGHVGACCKGDRELHRGYRWRYAGK